MKFRCPKCKEIIKGVSEAIKQMNLLCKLFGHKWIHLEKRYEGEINGKICVRCLVIEEQI